VNQLLVRQLQAQAVYRRSVAVFRARRRADDDARTRALLSEVVAILAEALEAEDRCDRCASCLRALSPRRRTCQRCGAPVALAELRGAA
jgi:uncharacterized OB-fold protein